ncbi:putative reverse transcriptase zinc-binding domain-containing protein [Helianthus annuus]|nr:putative reverse transcriptase zinc-binding domain-containing protein [Helianthus annuus]KAJ0894922.1 putative reverse transcriptase zinc-binding domain-containing protein [Helianthus annuus]
MDRIIKHKALGGVGVGGIQDFNDAMILKGWWRFKDDSSPLWAKVISVIHSFKVQRQLIPVNHAVPGIWKDIGSMENKLSQEGIEISDKLRVSIGDGSKTLFWYDRWAAPRPLKEVYLGLFCIANDKNITVAGKLCSRSDRLGWRWDWSREPRSNSEQTQFSNLLATLDQICLNNNQDVWKWENKEELNFSVKSIRLELAEKRLGKEKEAWFYWNAWATLKANYLGWRAMLGRIALKVGLAAHGVQMPNLLYDRCGYGIEDPDHIFVSCLLARSVWWNIFRCIRVSLPPNITKLSEILKTLRSSPGAKKWKKLVHVVALATVWWIWKARNMKVFDGRFVSIDRMIENIKEKAFVWITHRSRLPNPDWDKWVVFDVVDLL